MKRLFGLLLLVLAAVALSNGCNGANEVAGPGPGGPDHKVFQPAEPTPVPRLTPRPDPADKRPDRPCRKDKGC